MIEKYDIIIQAGQSNAEGMGMGEVEKEYQPTFRICALSAEKTVEHFPENLKIVYADKPFDLEIAKEREYQGGKIADFALPFATLYEKELLDKDRKILIIRAAVGGSGFKKGQWLPEGVLYLKMLEMVDYALSLNPQNRVVGFLWHQGEHDAFEKNPPNRFKEQLKEMIISFRNHYDLNKLPFIAGDFVNEWKSENLSDCEPIVNAMKEVVKEIGYGDFIETSDLKSNNQTLSNGDNIHFCRSAQYVLGQRYFKAYKKIVIDKG